MDVILDTNIYFHDLRMRGNQFQELFTYLRRKGSRLVIPEVVSTELLAKYREKLTEAVAQATGAWRLLQKTAITDLEDFPAPNIDDQIDVLRTKLNSPARGVEVTLYDDMAHIDIHEIVRRGAERIRPANPKGEELRDVILWLVVLQYAKLNSVEVAFVSDDSTFADSDGSALHQQLASDVAKAGVRISFYSGIRNFITQNALTTELVEEEWVWTFLTKDAIEAEAKQSLSWVSIPGGGGFLWRIVQNVEIDVLRFETGKRYRADEESLYAEILFRGTARVTVQTPSFGTVQEVDTASGTNLPFQGIWDFDNLYVAETVPVQLRVLPARVQAQPILFEQNFQVGYGGVVNPATKEIYRCQFELEISVRTTKGHLVAYQTERFGTVNVEAVADLAPH